MKILISDYLTSMLPDHTLEIETLKKGLGEDVEIEVYEYTDEKKDEFIQKLSEVDAILTAFIKLDKEVLSHAKNLKVISLNSTGYDGVDLEYATSRNIGVCPVGEYCSEDVSESAVAYLYALSKGFKTYQNDIENNYKWDFSAFEQVPRVSKSKIGIFGLGKIGKTTARKLNGLVEDIFAYDPYVDQFTASKFGVTMVDEDYIYENCDVIINHMRLTDENVRMFSKEKFLKMKKYPLFINLSRGLTVDHDALIYALDNKIVRGAGLDVLDDETPDLKNNKLVGRDNVIITPHSSFYSKTSIDSLAELSSLNIVYYLKGEKSKVFKLVN